MDEGACSYETRRRNFNQGKAAEFDMAFRQYCLQAKHDRELHEHKYRNYIVRRHLMTNEGLELIKRYEGFRAKPYLCPAGVPTIGYMA